jgi:four helix bundle protein
MTYHFFNLSRLSENIKVKMNDIEFSEGFKKRTKDFSLRVIKLYKSLSGTVEGQVTGKQLLRSGTFVAANYRAACRARSRAEFFSKMSIVVEEADESVFWMELLISIEIIPSKQLEPLISEANEILSIVDTARKTSKKA